ncbi:dTDP-4-dehydrorhamnose reductase [Ardenticatena maritima]|uniref:dTDP-4-dehydrorhamnose reductase n=1 Tax=Ardenticatena maritima TaxID=872965 RepID=A0A0M8K9F1_9CHLR|nr:SDR family oxidoreductase [Ardenticatena maritima]KPL88371.1 hypothetical protein SE16_06020 [Ardenticatena maritima]GAP64455.1 dTDP-4-dehydrorhamnose reductase [Ardenticatena maritima]
MTPPIVLLTGAAGVLGRALLRHAPITLRVVATQRQTPVPWPYVETIDLAEREQVFRLFAQRRPNIVLHTAAGFRDETLARDVEAATQNIALAAAEFGSALIHISTDLVFDGKHAPYDEQALPHPIHPYGRAKAVAEAIVREHVPSAAIVRTSLILDINLPDRNSAWVIQALRRGEPVSLFVDELRCPIPADDLARQLWELVRLPTEQRAGVWHLVGPEALSRYALGLLLAVRHGLPTTPIRAAFNREFPTPRPRDVRLLSSRAATLTTRARGATEYLII